jgi:hypothetical protein
MTRDPSFEPVPAAPAVPAAAQGTAPASEPATEAPVTEPSAPASAPTSRGPGRLRIGLVSGAAAALAIGGVATALAASPAADPAINPAMSNLSAWTAPAAAGGIIDGGIDAEHGRFGGRGAFRDITVTAISGSSISLATSDGWTRTVTVTDAMDLTKGGQPIELSDIAVGDEIRLLQERADDGTVTVTGIAVVVPKVAGEVSDLSSSGFTLTGRDGAVWTITLTGDTLYRYGAADGTLADVANGDTVLVLGTSTGDNALTATTVAVAGDRAMGTVTATSSTSITIQDRSGDSVTVHVDADTVYRVAGDDEASLADIAVDDVIAVSGRERADGSIDAAVVMDGGRGGGPGFGERGGHGGPGPGGPGFWPGVDGQDAVPDTDVEGSSTGAG